MTPTDIRATHYLPHYLSLPLNIFQSNIFHDFGINIFHIRPNLDTRSLQGLLVLPEICKVDLMSFCTP